MCALFNDAAFFQHDDIICFEDGIEAMRDCNDSSSLHETVRRFLKQGFGFGIKAGGWFIKDKDWRIFQESTRKCETLRLSAAETCPAFAGDGLIFLGQCFDEPMQMCGFCGFDDFFLCRIGFAKTNISIKSVMEKV